MRKYLAHQVAERHSSVIPLLSVSSPRWAPLAILHIMQLSSPIPYGWNGVLGNDVIRAGIWARQLFPPPVCGTRWGTPAINGTSILIQRTQGSRRRTARFFIPDLHRGNRGIDVQVEAQVLPQLRVTLIEILLFLGWRGATRWRERVWVGPRFPSRSRPPGLAGSARWPFQERGCVSERRLTQDQPPWLWINETLCRLAYHSVSHERHK